MAFEIPTGDDQHALMVADFANTFRHDPPDVSEGSFNWLWLQSLAMAITSNHAHHAASLLDLLPDNAEGQALRHWAELRGVVPKTATPARKARALRVPGAAGTNVPAGATLVHASGLRFQITNADVVGPSEYVDVGIVAIDVGSATRLNAGESLTFEGGPPDPSLGEVCELQLDMDEDGDDEETDEDLQPRVVNRFSDPPMSGAANDYVQAAIAETGWHDAYAYPLRRGWGSLDLVALHKGSGSARIPLAPEVADLQAKLEKKRIVGVKAFRVLLVNAQIVDVEYTIIPNGDEVYAFDWDDSTPPVVSTWDPVTRKLVFVSDRPASMKAGDRITFAGGATGKERVIDALDADPKTVFLTLDATGDTPAGNAYSGGPLVQLVRAAIAAHFKALGPANRDSKRYGSWEGNLRPNAIGRVSTAVAGVLDGTCVLPVATVEATDPAYPNDASVNLIIPGRVLVRWEH